ncbi:FAD-dependent monooxygenase [Epilithonimonas hungarica]|uniref:2,4-dichlorophenol 6-monooxygenase n=1 Tax=Epilithonimonas hungarica TaxID=454006 RepID=A0A1G7SCX7_9FLAO|nr:FAD-dependent monooxygenase [Epilithonimonas hungarica]SDG20050.1 2,4-dichlorophenol 6-monooxygenase [Epilithonimonas hungarica]
MKEIKVPVLIVGGGACGLTSSLLLSDLKIESLLVERHESTSHLPKAHYLNQRTMEILRQHGVADDVVKVGCPIDNMGKIVFRTSFGGDGTLDGKVIYELDAFGGRSLKEKYAKDGPILSNNYPQFRFEPLLRKHAEDRKYGQLLFSHELIEFNQDDNGITATITNKKTNETFVVKADYMIAADGGKTIGKKLGVKMEGPTNILNMVSTHFSAELHKYWDEETLLTFLTNPEGGDSWSSGAMAKMGPSWDKSEEYVIHFMFRPDDPTEFTKENMVPRVRQLLKVPDDLEINVHAISSWILEGVLADRYQFDRIFIAGDAAHRHPPTTGLGMNTAIQDAHNLAWKLALVLKNKADKSLLDTYEKERRPIGMRNVDWAMFTFLNHFVMDAGIGLVPGAPVEQNKVAFEVLFSDTPMGRTRRQRVKETFDTQRTECQAHDLEMGFVYEDGAVIPDGTDTPLSDPMGCEYIPTTRPGHRLPHSWLKSSEKEVSTHDFTGASENFVLITGEKGDKWIDAAQKLIKETDLNIETVKIGKDTGWNDKSGYWALYGGINDDGVVIVRPDNHIAFRTACISENPYQTLESAFARLLGISVSETAQA